jgi:hypothetical protein
MNDGLVPLGRAGDAGADAGKCFTPFSRYRLSAIVAFLGAFAARRQRSGAKDGVLHGIVDLVLNCSVASPTARHYRILSVT